MLWFIMALGFDGTSVAGYAFLNNTLPRNPPFKGMLYNGNINEYTAPCLRHGLNYPVVLALVLTFMALDVVIMGTMLTKQYRKIKSPL